MPVFSAISRLQWINIRKRNPLNRYRLMNGRLISFQLSTATSTGARRCGQETQEMCARIRQASKSGKYLDAGEYVAHDGYQFTPQCRTSWPTSMAAHFGNPGPSGIGVVIDGSTDGTIRIAKWIGHQDNNVAEYLALLEALQCALGLEAEALHVFSDSEVMVRQMSGEYSCRSPRLYSLNWTCRKLARSLDFSISHVRRANNAEANRLASSAARNAGRR